MIFFAIILRAALKMVAGKSAGFLDAPIIPLLKKLLLFFKAGLSRLNTYAPPEYLS